MKGKFNIVLAASAAVVVISGCTGDTSVSTQPSQSEIDAGIQRRLAEVDKMPVSQEQKDRMKQQISGKAPDNTEAARAKVSPGG